jgi:hypothetical protein
MSSVPSAFASAFARLRLCVRSSPDEQVRTFRCRRQCSLMNQETQNSSIIACPPRAAPRPVRRRRKLSRAKSRNTALKSWDPRPPRNTAKARCQEAGDRRRRHPAASIRPIPLRHSSFVIRISSFGLPLRHSSFVIREFVIPRTPHRPSPAFPTQVSWQVPPTARRTHS